MVINALKMTQIKLKNWIWLVGALFLWALWTRGACSSCSASSMAAITQLQLLDACWHKRRFSRILPPCASHRTLAQISDSGHLSLHRLRKPAAHIYSLLQDHVMTKMLIASKCRHTWVMCSHSQKGSHRRRRNFSQVIPQKRLLSFAVDAVFPRLKYSQVWIL